MSDEYTKQKQKLEEFFSLSHLDALLDPYHVFPEVVAYYDGLPDPERIAFEDSVMAWLDTETLDLADKERRRHFSNGLSLCRELKLKRAHGQVLDIARKFALLRNPNDERQYDLPTSIHLGAISMFTVVWDQETIDFLRAEASHCGDINPTRASIAAIGILSQIDLDMGLSFLPLEITGDMLYREKRPWAFKETKQFGMIYETILDLLRLHGRGVVPKIAVCLQRLSTNERRFTLHVFQAVMQRLILEAAEGRIQSPEDKAQLVARFAADLKLDLAD